MNRASPICEYTFSAGLHPENAILEGAPLFLGFGDRGYQTPP